MPAPTPAVPTPNETRAIEFDGAPRHIRFEVVDDGMAILQSPTLGEFKLTRLVIGHDDRGAFFRIESSSEMFGKRSDKH